MQLFNIVFASVFLTIVGAQTLTGPCVGTTCPASTDTCLNGNCYITTTIPACTDIATNCATLKAGGYCANDKYASLMITNCARTCAKCSTNLPVKDLACVDTASNCASLRGMYQL
uniref:ShKT domain-containing protein n=1 Tax=Rhabditophanes sp. KR3021 TaxID=114890 RepID=A0AC35TNJ7_9BILA